MLKNLVGNNIKFIRTRNGITQDELASLCNIDRPQISKIEQGKVNITLDTLEKISNSLKVEPLILFNNNKKIHPFVKWAGGKTQILEKLCKYLPNSFNTYFEPFVGGGSLLFYLAPNSAVISDSNAELMCAYKCFQNFEDFELLKNELRKHEENHSEEYYYEIRNMDREEDFNSLPIYIRAARMIYLNKACFNGLYRVNSKGYFNVPSGKKNEVKTFDEENFNNLYKYFNNNSITILLSDFEEAVSKKANKNDFVYFDPPYDTLDDKNSFTSYDKNNFKKEEQARLASIFKKLDEKNVKVMLSNHNTNYIRELYKDYNIHIINAKRMINSNGNGRGNVEEVIITNY